MPTKTTTRKTTKTKAVKPAESEVVKKAKNLKEKEVPETPVTETPEVMSEPEPEIEGETKVNGPEKYYESVGCRKEATARIRVFTKKSADNHVSEDRALITVNNKPYFEYFPTSRLQNIVESPLRKLKSLNRFKATVKVKGGGIAGQADAIKFGLSRALVLFDPNFSKKLKKAGFLTRDAREKERRKYGLKKARKAPQWAKR